MIRVLFSKIILILISLPLAVVTQTLASDLSVSTDAPSADASQLEFFETRIRPVLVDQCYSCHSDTAKNPKGGLRLDSRDAILAGGDSGPALIVGNPQGSLMLKAMRHESLEMPPDKKLSDSVLNDFEIWIKMGAVDPRQGHVAPKKASIDIEKGREFWSFRPIVRSSIPMYGDGWARNDIDRFVAARHASRPQPAHSSNRSFTVAGDAEPDVLIRRLTFVLTGLPPTLSEQTEFATAWRDDPDVALQTTIDRLLNSPRFGECWGRHWLDVARFSESTGGGRSMMMPDAWRFRDYVIRSFNNDKPFNQLIREHLAGDLLPSSTDEQHDEQLIGVGYLMLGAINYEEQDKEHLRMDVVDEQIDSMGRSFLGMNLGCCRCHDHKFDPIPATDYYALAGIFRSTKSLTPGNVCGFVTAPLRVGFDQAAVDQWKSKDALLEKQILLLKQELKRGSENVATTTRTVGQGMSVDNEQFVPSALMPANAASTPPELTTEEKSVKQAELKRLEDERKTWAKSKPDIPTAMCVVDESHPADWHLHVRGEIRKLGPVVPRGFLTVATPLTTRTSATPLIKATTSGRMELANWIASIENPLTARVYVNRVWQHVLGEGLVRTPDNFGETGDRPTHPELLDYLASTFATDDEWSTKKLIRRICLSRTFRMSSELPVDHSHLDPDNVWLTRSFRRRLEAEAVRDSLLQIGGTLDLSIRSGRTLGKVPTYDNEYEHSQFPLNCRSVFVPSLRNKMLDMFEVFDTANPNIVMGQRTRSTRPAQSLFMLNSPFVIEQARLASQSFLKSMEFNPKNAESSIRNAFGLCLSREPNSDELKIFLNATADKIETTDAWAAVFHALFGSVDFRYLE